MAPHRYRLLFTAPLPGYDAQSERLVTASRAAMIVLLDLLADLPTARANRDIHPLDDQLSRWSKSRELADTPPDPALRAIITWSRLHGLISLEIEGNFASMGLDPELVFDAEVSALLTAHT